MEISKTVWIQSGNSFTKGQGNVKTFETLPQGIYKVAQTPMGGFYLQFVMPQFVFNYKLYGIQDDFIDHVLKTYSNTSGNLGILLNGTKGTGKTVTAKVLANKLQLPIIIVQDLRDSNQAMMNWLSTEIDCDCVFFFDEYEKTFAKDTNILSFMDGVYNQASRKIFLLTTNTLDIDENLINRPSRIAYLRTFGNLTKDIASEYLDDNLKDKSCKDELLGFVDTLTISTIDILKSIVNEVNIHGFKSFMNFRQSFNVQTESYDYQCTLGYITTDDHKDANKTTIKMFLEDKKRVYDDFTPAPQRSDFRKADGTINDDAFAKARNEYYNNRKTKFSFAYTTVTSDTKLQNLKKGDLFGGSTIVDIDNKHNVVVTIDNINDEINFYYVKNPEKSPSLWNGNAYGYGPQGYSL